MAFQIQKINTFPIAFKKDDEILAHGESLNEIPIRLADIGFADAKRKIVEGSVVYYKGRTNAVYVRHIHKPKKQGY
jgi:hypothetical protein